MPTMSRDLPPLNALRAFEAAARHQSFTRAAEELNVSHSAISRHVRGLEHRLSARLFRDLPRGVALSPEGARYFAAVAPALDQIAEATAAVREKPEGVIEVSAENSFAVWWVAPRLKRFRDLHPEIEVRVEATTDLVDLDRYEADIAIRFLQGTPQHAPQDLLSNSPVQVYAAPEIAETLRAPEDVLAHPLMRDRFTDLWPEWFRRAGLEGRYAPPTWRLKGALAIEAAQTGLCVLLAAQELLERPLREGRLVPCFDISFHSGAYFLLVGDGARRRKPVRLFRDWLLAEAAQARFPEALGG
jgi:DNA-binding transcriptional LysR family regulator